MLLYDNYKCYVIIWLTKVTLKTISIDAKRTFIKLENNSKLMINIL